MHEQNNSKNKTKSQRIPLFIVFLFSARIAAYTITMKKWLILLVVAVFALFGSWLWLLGSVPQKEIPTQKTAVYLTEVAGDVQVKLPDQEWSQAQENQEIPSGTTLKTMEGSVSVNWFSTGQTRLGARSELLIEQAMQAELERGTVVKAKLQSGRIWTRMMRLLDLNSEMSVETSDVIATVRGTVFDVEATTNTNIWVSDSVVDVQDRSVPPGVQTGLWSVPEGEMIRVGKGIKTSSTALIPQSGMQTDWFIENQKKDEEFVSRLVNGWKQYGESLDTNESDTHFAMRQWSEQMRAKLMNQEKRHEQQTASMLRELGRMRLMIDQGKSGAALHAMTRFENRLTDAMENKMIDRMAMRAVIKRAYSMFDHIASDTPEYRLRQRLEEWIEKMSEDEAERGLDRLMLIATQADEAARALEENDVERASLTITTADTGLDNLMRDLKDKQLTDEKKRLKLEQYIQALDVRIEALKRRLKIANENEPHEAETPSEVVPVAATSTSSTKPVTVPTSTRPTTTSIKATTTKPIITTPTPVPTPTTSQTGQACLDITVSMQPSPINVGQTGTMTVRATLADGSVQDVSNAATYQIFGQIASIKGRSITGTSAGSAQLSAKYECAGKNFEKNFPIQVIEERKLEAVSLLLVASPSTIDILDNANLSAFLVFSDGTRQNVTTQTNWTMSATGYGSLRGNIFSAYQSPATVLISGAYTDAQGKAWSGGVSITIQSPTTKP